MRRTVWDRFWAKIDRRAADECWPWTGARSRQGYGKLRVGTLTPDAHRLSYEFFYGPIPVGLHVLHTCDNPPCVNPAHLWLGTVADNMQDRNKKGRGRGEPNAPRKYGKAFAR
jgi:hypothetical protein